MTLRNRHNQLLKLIAQEALSQQDLARLLGCSDRTIRSDMEALAERFPGYIRNLRDEQNRICYQWQGLPPHLLDDSNSIAYLDHLELVALVAARGLLTDPQSADFSGPLDGAIDRLLRQLGVGDEAHKIDPRAIQIDRFAALSENPEHLSTCIRAVLEQRSLSGSYRNIHNEAHAVELLPQRLLVIDNEFHCLAWDAASRQIKNYRLSRFEELSSSHIRPLHAPDRIDPATVEEHRRYAFRSHCDPQQRQRVVLALHPSVHPHTKGRHWGGEQEWQDNPDDLPDGWARLSFTTSGLPACQHWVLSLGSGVIAEGPDELCQWLRKQARDIVCHYRQPPANRGTA